MEKILLMLNTRWRGNCISVVVGELWRCNRQFCRCLLRVKLAQAVDATTSYVLLVPIGLTVIREGPRSKCCATGVNLVAI